VKLGLVLVFRQEELKRYDHGHPPYNEMITYTHLGLLDTVGAIETPPGIEAAATNANRQVRTGRNARVTCAENGAGRQSTRGSSWHTGQNERGRARGEDHHKPLPLINKDDLWQILIRAVRQPPAYQDAGGI